jgi:hypothetical protein
MKLKIVYAFLILPMRATCSEQHCPAAVEPNSHAFGICRGRTNCTFLQENRPGLVLHRRTDASKRYTKTNLSLCLEQKNLLPLLEIEPRFIGRPV